MNNMAQRPPSVSAASRRLQRGVAAIEFALIFSVLFLVLYGMATFGAVFYFQQAVSRAAEDGARAVSQLPASPGLSENDPRIVSAVRASLLDALVVPASESVSIDRRRSWIATNVTATIAVTEGTGARAVVTVTYKYSANRLLPKVPAFGWMPDELTGRAIAMRQT